jgi:large subunit ribosomal protein L1
VESLRENLVVLLDAINKAKPAGAKGVYVRKVSVSSTMGIGVRIDQASLSAR